MTEAPPAGWYNDPTDPLQRRYWDGEKWTEHTAGRYAPPAVDQPQARMKQCPYCQSQMPQDAIRCQACGGELSWCPNCKDGVGTSHKEKFVGVLRGGIKTQYRCMRCGKVLDGPRF